MTIKLQIMEIDTKFNQNLYDLFASIDVDERTNVDLLSYALNYLFDGNLPRPIDSPSVESKLQELTEKVSVLNIEIEVLKGVIKSKQENEDKDDNSGDKNDDDENSDSNDIDDGNDNNDDDHQAYLNHDANYK